jgi:hypothetical protein
MRGKIVVIGLMLLIGIVMLNAVNLFVNDIDLTQYPSGMAILISILPLISCCLIIISIVNAIGKDIPQEKIDWLRYGERLKLGYTAKFGGENQGFNNEVDYKIKIMVNTDKGFTRQLAKDWIKRMSKFTNIDWLKMDDGNDEN